MLPTQCLCTNLRRAARGVSRHYDGALDGFGINVAQYSLLCNLKRLDQPSISTLAEAMGLDRSTLGRNVRVLEGAGLLKMTEGADLLLRPLATNLVSLQLEMEPADMNDDEDGHVHGPDCNH